MLTAPSSAAARTRAVSVALPLFAGTLFVSAFLLFSVQPMFTKMILPMLGGSSSVWSVAMVFFQAALLGGYLYAHLLVRLVPLPVAAALHLGLNALAFVLLPIAVAGDWGRPPADGEALWLIGLFAVSVGLPFFAVAANGPLLQAWFARSGHPSAKDPYFLYSASNLGSFAALLSYPIAIEPLLSLGDQSRLWQIGFVLLCALIALCALQGTRAQSASPERVASPSFSDAGISLRRRLAWIGLAAVPSGLLVSVTAHISTDVAAAPLLWVVPLALFLLTFVIGFRDGSAALGAWMSRIQVWGTALVLLGLVWRWPLGAGLALHLGLFFVNALVCHAALYRLRPPAARLTEFYLLLSLGGVVGGVLCSLVAPLVFSTVLEYPILLVAALACRPDLASDLSRLTRRSAAAAATIVVSGAFLVPHLAGPGDAKPWLVAVTMLVALLLLARTAPLKVAAAVALALAALSPPSDGSTSTAHRSFFGVHRTVDIDGGRFRVLMHGTTVHGAMRLRDEAGAPVGGRPELLTYFTPEGGYGQALSALREAQGGRLRSVAVAGLGAGLIACHAAPGESWSFFEIDPVVVRLARDPATFTFLERCTPDAPVVLGDARLTLAEETERKSLIVLDAFTSDAVPAHLLTREAIGLYLSKLDATGAMIFHITNRHLELRNILARTAAEHGLVTFVMDEPKADEPFGRRLRAPIKIAVVARDPRHVGAIATNGRWERVVPQSRRRPWTDDFSNILDAVIEHHQRAAPATRD